jgi:hypothetical protein
LLLDWADWIKSFSSQRKRDLLLLYQYATNRYIAVDFSLF